MFDITQFAPAEKSFLHLKSPDTEEPLFTGSGDDKRPVGITFHAPGSSAYETAANKRTNRQLTRSKRKIDLTADLLRSDTVDLLTDITISFDELGYPPAVGATGEALFKALYGDRKYGWVVEQANVHVADWGNVSKRSATS